MNTSSESQEHELQNSQFVESFEVEYVDELTEWKQIFVYDESTKKTKCSECNKLLIGKYEQNWKRHLNKYHQDIAKNFNAVIKKRPAEIDSEIPKKKHAGPSRGGYIKHCVALIVIHLLPLISMTWEPFRDLTNPFAKAAGFVMNAVNIITFIAKSANAIRLKVKREIRHRMISLKLDVASRGGKSVLGVNIQYYSKVERKIVIRTLGMITLESRHTSSYLELMINALLKLYDIDKRNIYSYTSDNGKNMISLGNLIKTTQHFLLLNDELRHLQNNYSDEDNEDEDNDYDNNENNASTSEHENIKKCLNEVFTIFVVIRCAAHTLQLAVLDTIKQLDCHSMIDDIRNVVKIIKLDRIKEARKSLGIKTPKLDVVTRWNSMYQMLKTLQNQKELLIKLFQTSAKEFERHIFDVKHWNLIDKFVEAFAAPYECTKLLQFKQMCIGMTLIFHFKFKNIIIQFYFRRFL